MAVSFYGDRLQYGLTVGSDLREGDCESNRDLNKLESIESALFGSVYTNLNKFELEFFRLAGIDVIEEEPPNARATKPRRTHRPAAEAKMQVVF